MSSNKKELTTAYLCGRSALDDACRNLLAQAASKEDLISALEEFNALLYRADKEGEVSLKTALFAARRECMARIGACGGIA